MIVYLNTKTFVILLNLKSTVMKSRVLIASRISLAALILFFAIMLISWKKHEGGSDQKQVYVDTIPQSKERTVRDLDEALEELNRIDLGVHINQAMESVAEAMKQFDAQKIQLEIQKAMQSVDMEKVKEDMAKALKEVDFEKIGAEINASLKEVDWSEIKKDIEEAKLEIENAKKIDFEVINREIAKAQEEIKKVGPQIEKELAKAKVGIEKAKETIREYKAFIDSLEQDGLLNTKEDYTIVHKNGKLIVNGKEVPSSIYNKYKSFLDKHKKIHVNKNERLSINGDDDEDDNED